MSVSLIVFFSSAAAPTFVEVFAPSLIDPVEALRVKNLVAFLDTLIMTVSGKGRG